MHRKRALIVTVVGVGIGAVLWGLLGRAAGKRDGEPERAALRFSASSAVRSVPVTPAVAVPAPRDVPAAAAPPRGELPPAALARATADDYRRSARYPRSSQPLADGQDPIAREGEVTPVAMRGRGGADPTLEVFPGRIGFESPEAAVLHAVLSAAGRPLRARDVRATVSTEEGKVVATLEYNDDGVGGDAEAGDRLYTGVFTPPPQPIEALAVSYLVTVTARTLDDDERIAATSFLYSTPHARLTGKFRDAIVDGSLAIEAEVEVVRPGRFHLEGTLYSGDGSRPLAWSQTAGELGEGTHWMSLSYYGLILREGAVDGPYLLRWLELSTTTAMPNAKSRPLENAWVTRAYGVAAFTDRPFGDPALLDAAGRIERDAGLEAGG